MYSSLRINFVFAIRKNCYNKDFNSPQIDFHILKKCEKLKKNFGR